MRLVIDFKHDTKKLHIKTSDGQLIERYLDKDLNLLIEPYEPNYINPEFDKYK